jgi:hypothetical protein
MSKDRPPFNPSKVADMLDKSMYAKGSKGEELKSEREDLVAWLRKKGKKSQACLGLADKLDSCRPRNRCRSPACPECGTAGQRLVATTTRQFLKAQTTGSTVVCVTVVPADGMMKPGKLNKTDHELAIRRWKEKLGKAGVTWFVGATDLSFNEHKQAKRKPRWSEHFYGVTRHREPEKLKRALKALFPKTKAIPRPVKVKVWDGNKKALLYILKPNFWRRIATEDAQRHNKTTGATRLCRATNKQYLKSKQKRELLVYLDDIGIKSRLLMRWCQLNKKPGGPTIKLCLPK